MRFWFSIFCIVLALTTGAAVAQQPRPEVLNVLASGGTGGWVNTTRPLTTADFKDRLILLDFWTYGCINCMHVIPDLDYLEKKYPQVLVIGVHSAKYTGESLNERIRQAVDRFAIHHPVMNDHDYKVWDLFEVRAWPTLVLLDSSGAEISRYAGEGHRAELERDIVRTLKDTKMTGERAAESLVTKTEQNGPLLYPSHLAVIDDTTLAVSDTGNHQIVLFDTATGKIKQRIGSGKAGFTDGASAVAAFNMPRGLTMHEGVLYVADTVNHALRAIDSAGNVTTLGGDGTRGYDRTPGGLAKGKPMASPWDVEMLADGQTLAIAMAGTHQLWRYDIKNGEVYVLAGNGREDIADETALKAELAQPSGLSRLGDAIYFVDAESSSLRVLKDNTVRTLIGTGLFDFGQLDGIYPTASLQHPQGVFAHDKKVYVADTYNDALRVYDTVSKKLSTLKLDGAVMNEPGDVAVLGNAVYMTDTGNSRILRIDAATGTATEVTLTP